MGQNRNSNFGTITLNRDRLRGEEDSQAVEDQTAKSKLDTEALFDNFAAIFDKYKDWAIGHRGHVEHTSRNWGTNIVKDQNNYKEWLTNLRGAINAILENPNAGPKNKARLANAIMEGFIRLREDAKTSYAVDPTGYRPVFSDVAKLVTDTTTKTELLNSYKDINTTINDLRSQKEDLKKALNEFELAYRVGQRKDDHTLKGFLKELRHEKQRLPHLKDIKELKDSINLISAGGENGKTFKAEAYDKVRNAFNAYLKNWKPPPGYSKDVAGLVKYLNANQDDSHYARLLIILLKDLYAFAPKNDVDRTKFEALKNATIVLPPYHVRQEEHHNQNTWSDRSFQLNSIDVSNKDVQSKSFYDNFTSALSKFRSAATQHAKDIGTFKPQLTKTQTVTATDVKPIDTATPVTPGLGRRR